MKKKNTVKVITNSSLNMKEDVMSALIRRAVGYSTEETVEEYSIEDGKCTLIKRKVSSKEYPPDLSAISTVLEFIEDKKKDISELTDEELIKEKERLLKELKASEINGQIKMNLEGNHGD